ncbi:DUF5327 family protein [Staphylococcus petrasii]|uniref:DUF5327 family protein n=1 Tax=Staphylococcus petrasii TaxID=1276936 RepID=UPI001F5771D9|nr:DUF5327 family protein [Staphylococcus petrasii]MCI2773800.1 YwdI family protein [Staphylococcus petrasii]
MDKEQIIQLIERELVQADEANNSHEFEKHMYAIHTLTSLYANQESAPSTRRNKTHDFTDTVTAPSFSKNNNTMTSSGMSHSASSSKSTVTAAEIEAMGGKVPNSMKSSQNNSLPSDTMVTDDEIGNGESIFDF